MVENVDSTSSKNTLALEARQVGAEAEVLADAEREVRVGRAVDVEAVRVVEHGLVAVRRRVVHEHLVAGGDLGVVEHGVGGGGAPEVVERVLVAEDLLDRAGQQRVVGAHLGQLLRVLQEREQTGRQHRLGGVVARGDELHEEDAEVEIAHRAVAEVAGEDQRRQVVARCLGAPLRGELHRVHRHLHGGGFAGAVVLGRVADDVGILATGVRLRPAPGSGASPRGGRPMSSPTTWLGSSVATSCTKSTSAASRAVAMISRQMVRIRPSSPPMTRALKLGASGRR